MAHHCRELVGRKAHAQPANELVQARFTELAKAFVHVIRAANTAGLYDQLVAMLVEILTTRALDAAENAE